MTLFSHGKRATLRMVDRMGYAVMHKHAYKRLRDHAAELQNEVDFLRDTLNGMPEIDYQVWMDHQAKAMGFKNVDPSFHALYESVKPYTMTSIERLYALHKAVEYIVRAEIPGDIVECGVWRGGSMIMAALSALVLGDTSRRIVLFDTFAGLPKPDPEKDGADNFEEWKRRRINDESSNWAHASLEDVQANLRSTGYPSDKVAFVQGLTQKTLPIHAPDNISLLRLDTDWYESTRHELDCLFPRLCRKGVIILDDYGALAGSKRAVDEYFSGQGETLLFNRVDSSCLMAVRA